MYEYVLIGGVTDACISHNEHDERTVTIKDSSQNDNINETGAPWLPTTDLPKNVKWGETLIKIPRWNNKLNEAEALEKP